MKGVTAMNQKVQELVDAVAAQTGTIESMKAFIAGLEQQIKDALSGVTLPAEVEAALGDVFNAIKSNTQAVADAIDNDPNTPAAPTP